MKDITKKRIIRWFWILFTIPVALVALLLLLVWAFADIPSFEELENPESKLATQVIAEDGEIQRHGFIIIAGTGLDATIMEKAAASKNEIGEIAYVLSALSTPEPAVLSSFPITFPPLTVIKKETPCASPFL